MPVLSRVHSATEDGTYTVIDNVPLYMTAHFWHAQQLVNRLIHSAITSVCIKALRERMPRMVVGTCS
jgi:ABC-type transporter Mla maintaining outer membrane lipid asymmetry ATPase subunit MlaF